MKKILELLEKQPLVNEPATISINRRAFLTRTAVASLGIAAVGMGLSGTSVAQSTVPQPLVTNVQDERQYREVILGLGTVALLTSQIGLEKGRDTNVREFAGFEITEQTALSNVLTDLGTTAPPMSPADRATLETLRTTTRGKAFDRAFITAQYNTHVRLRDVTEAFLRSSNQNDATTRHTRHIATVALATIKEHVILTNKLAQKLR